MTNTIDYSDNRVSFFISNKSNSLEVRKVTNGGYTADEVVEMLGDMLESGHDISNWAIWDATKTAPKQRRDRPFTNAEIKKMCSKQEVALVWCRRGTFKAPVIKIGEIKAVAERKARASTRLGR